MDLRLIGRNLLSHPVRSVMTVLSVALAVFLVCILQATVTALEAATSEASNERLWVQSAVSLYVDMPLSYESKIASVDGVKSVCRYQWFGGKYQDGDSFFAQFGVDPEAFLSSYPEFVLQEGDLEAFKTRRTACVVGDELADQLGWKVGDTVSLEGTFFPKADGSAWDFDVVGIFGRKTTALDTGAMFFHFDYLMEGIDNGDVLGTPGVGVYLIDVADGAAVTAVMAAVDALFENGPQRVQTTTEAEFSRQFISMLGNIPLLLRSIGGAIVFAIFFAILNTMLMVARERTRTIGVLKALGFTDAWVFLGMTTESVLLCVLGGALGLVFALAISGGARQVISGFAPGFAIDGATMVFGLGLAVGLGLLGGVLPAWGASKVRPVDALKVA